MNGSDPRDYQAELPDLDQTAAEIASDEVDESEHSSLEEPPEEEPSPERPVFDAADNSPARQPQAGTPTPPVRFPSAGGVGMIGFGG